MSYPYICLHCNRQTDAAEPGERLIQCECGEAAWAVRCQCQGQADSEGTCMECGRRC
jgi:hypothetical protein